jgi:autotransporter strand-loop-strand O-heptosyltransferase
MPVVEEFRKKHNVEVYCSTFHNQLFQESYPNIHWINRGAAIPETRCVYRVGWFGKGEVNFKNPIDCRTIPLQQVAGDILGIDVSKELRPTLTRDKRAPLYNHPNYVVITTASTAQAKYWNLQGGWQELINWLNSRGYTVVNVGREPNNLNGVIDYCNNKPMMDLVNLIQYSKFFIGLGSGLSWMAWALGKKSVMISGFSQDWCEFKEDNYRIINKSVCHGCFNDPTHFFDKGNWWWCPRHEKTNKHFECTKAISVQTVRDKIQELESDLNRI